MPTVARLLLDYLKAEGVDAVFGIPGGPVTPIFDALYHEPSIKTISTRHECGAAFMAAGYARASGRLGVCCLTTGPGTTNAITGIAAAKADSLPVLAVSAQVATATFGKGSLQDSSYDRADVVAMLKPVTKLSAMLAHPANAGMMLRQGIRYAMSGQRGPVHINVPTDLMRREAGTEMQAPANYRPSHEVFDRQAVRRAAQALLEARRPAILAGHGVNLSGAAAELLELAETLGIAVATTPKGKGAFPELHELSLRVFGIATSPWAQEYLLNGGVDVLLVLGSGMHEISTQAWERGLRPSAALIQQDIEPTVIGRNYPVDIALVGDMKATLREVLFQLRRLSHGGRTIKEADPFLRRLKERVPAVSEPLKMESAAVPIKPQRLMAELARLLPADALIYIDSGNNTLWSIHYLNATGHNTFVHNWGEFGAMGYGVAAPIGAKLAVPARPVIGIVGDGSFGMMGMEISTAATYGIAVVWIVMNDARYNAVHHGQQLQYGGRTIGTEFKRIDAAKIARALGAEGWRVEEPDELETCVSRALACGRPAVVDVLVDGDEVPPIHSRVRALDQFFAGLAQ